MDITISLEEYNILKRKEFVYDLKRDKYAAQLHEGRYVDIEDKIAYGLMYPVEDSVQRIREKLKEEQDW